MITQFSAPSEFAFGFNIEEKEIYDGFLNVFWRKPCKTNGNIDKFVLSWMKLGSSQESIIVNVTDDEIVYNATLSNLNPQSKYIISLRADAGSLNGKTLQRELFTRSGSMINLRNGLRLIMLKLCVLVPETNWINGSQIIKESSKVRLELTLPRSLFDSKAGSIENVMFFVSQTVSSYMISLFSR